MAGLGNFPIDLVLLGMVALFLILRLRSVLGKRTEFEPGAMAPVRPQASPPGRIIDVRPERADPAAARTMPPRESPTGQALSRIQAIDPQFSPTRFLESADGAFRLIVLAFARGDRAALKPLLTPAMQALFEQAIATREADQLTQHATLHSIRSLAFEDAAVDGTTARITIRFVSDQVSYTSDRNNDIVVGTEAVTEITDLWSFERDLSSRDQAWRLAGTRSG